MCNLKHISCKFHKRKDVIYAVRGTAHTLFPVDGLCLCMTYPINGRAVTRAKSKRRVRFSYDPFCVSLLTDRHLKVRSHTDFV